MGFAPRKNSSTACVHGTWQVNYKGNRGKSMATDPVCGMQVDERTAAGRSVFEGRNYYFCSAGCKKKFEADPSAYPSKAPAGDTKRPEHVHPHAPATPEPPDRVHGKPALAGVVPAGTVYTCPMHPEIVRDAPGHC